MNNSGEPDRSTSGVISLQNPGDFHDPAARIVHLPRSIRSKQKLFAILSDKLRFPAYFGWNWDALEELLRDLSWLPSEPIVLVHEDLPFGAGGKNREVYEALIREVAAHWQAVQPGRLRFVVPANAC